MKFDEKQIEYMRSLGLNFNYKNLSDDELIKIEDIIGDELTLKGLDEHCKPNNIGLMCESILDALN